MVSKSFNWGIPLPNFTVSRFAEGDFVADSTIGFITVKPSIWENILGTFSKHPTRRSMNMEPENAPLKQELLHYIKHP